ncbi:MAG: hypothetical protein MMC23_002439 [Stictis urceolatum]|nr:hypothetical protein [Stictis urceolata]
MLRATSLALSLAAAVRAQQVGTSQAEVHPSLSSQSCTSSGCTTASTKIVLDANWRWLHTTSGYTNCYTGNTWDATLCPDATTCAKNCAVDGADYSGTYGISTSGNALTLKFVTQGSTGGKNIGSRVYLMQDDSNYQMFKLLNKEFTFDADVSNLPCGLNGALYFSEMDQDGGLAKYPTNKAGAKYGTGYCDAQCPQDLKFINGLANVVGWNSSASDPNSGTGTMGTCCSEMDIWEANSISNAYTPHPCTVNGQTMCTGTQCGSGSDRYSGVCDKDGCDFNPYRMGDTSFYGPGETIDTKSKFTVVTQFITSDGTDTGTLSEIKRFYVQNGKTFANTNTKIAGIPAQNYISDSWCAAQKSVFGDTNDFKTKGGLAQMGAAMKTGMVLVMSLWDDHAADALWLDSTYPTTSTALGAKRGTCATTSGVPADVEANSPNASVTFSNIKFGAINSTFASGGAVSGGGGSGTVSTTLKASTTTVKTSTSSPASGSGSVAKYGQCGGTGWTGATACVSGSTCTVVNPYYSQCM